MKLEKIKLVNVVDEKMAKDALKLILGGTDANGCPSGVCSSSSSNKENCTNGDGVCKSSVVV